MSINYDKYLYSTGTHYISNSGSDENKGTHGGKAGDQTGKEWQLKPWYKRPWTVVLRYHDQTVALKIAELGIAAALNNKIGYDQYQRATYWTQLKAAGYDPFKITTPCEEDCTAGVTANVRACGYIFGIPALQALDTSGTRSSNMRARFVKAGFKALTASKYLTSGKYLLPGDILLYENHHAATNVTCGTAVRDEWHPGTITPTTYKLGDRDLKKGDKGPDVKELQEDLKSLGYDFPKYSCDGDFGAETETNVKGFQRISGLEATGVFDHKSYEAMLSVIGGYVLITGNSVNVRSGPSKECKSLGVVHKGDKLPFGGLINEENGWCMVDYQLANGWVSPKYSELMEGKA